MTVTIAQAFSDLKSNLEITGLQESTLATRQQTVRATLQAGQEVLDDFLTGSYRRKTMIAPLKEADIDVFVVYPSSYFNFYNGQNGGPAGLLDFTKQTLLKRYTRTPSISRNGQAITIRFDDFVVDVVTGFSRNGGGYLIANSVSNSWLSTDPKKHVELISASNKWHNDDFIPLVKMIKGWNKSHGSFFRSFHLEVLALQILTNVKITDFPSGVRFFFDKSRDLIKQQNLDPAGYGDDVGRYLDTASKVQDAVARLTSAYNQALRAEQYATGGNIHGAITEWKKIFSNYFPAYG